MRHDRAPRAGGAVDIDKIIGSIRRYIGTYHAWATGQQVVVVTVLRRERVLHDDAAIGELGQDDVIEFAPLVKELSGRVRPSFATSDARPDELGPPEGILEGEPRTFLMIEGRPMAQG